MRHAAPGPRGRNRGGTTYGLFGPSHHRGHGPEVFFEGFGRAERLVDPTTHRLAGSTGPSCAWFSPAVLHSGATTVAQRGQGTTARQHTRRRGGWRATGGRSGRRADE